MAGVTDAELKAMSQEERSWYDFRTIIGSVIVYRI